MRIVPVACLKDNYAYLVICEATREAAVVDPSEAAPVLAAAQAEDAVLRAIWNTHHHYDHTGGNKELLDRYPELPVVAHASDRGRVPGQSMFAEEGDVVRVGKEVAAEIIYNPGHTTGAISYYIAEPGAVFTGDTMFGAGCGRLFEGTPAQMLDSLERLSKLPADTLVYCGHEYTEANLHFALAVEPSNADALERQAKVRERRGQGLPSVPFAMREELASNVFLRMRSPELRARLPDNEPPADDSDVEVFAALRRWKDRF